MEGAGSTAPALTGGTLLPAVTPSLEPASEKPCIVFTASLAESSAANSSMAVPQCSSGCVVEGRSEQERTMPKAWKTVLTSFCPNSLGMPVTTALRRSRSLPVSPPAAAVVAMTESSEVLPAEAPLGAEVPAFASAAPGEEPASAWPPDAAKTGCCVTPVKALVARVLLVPRFLVERPTFSFCPPRVKSCREAMALSAMARSRHSTKQ
mmetsp:Transcript_8714/g.24564  ORF Transcript_8714/g.24564 Transcript_8714/m.24564 type:complete len:208 (+) Transcript_8714:395-1018(+)